MWGIAPEIGRDVRHESIGKYFAFGKHGGIQKRFQNASSAATGTNNIYLVSVLRTGFIDIALIDKYVPGSYIQYQCRGIVDPILAESAVVTAKDVFSTILQVYIQGGT